MSRAAGGTLIAALIAMGLVAGLYYAFACAVMPGLARAADRTFVETMQRINVAIVNPAFFFSFFGAFALTALAMVLQWRLGRRDTALWIAAALALYTVTLVITVAVNVPLNDMLARAGDPNTAADLSTARRLFERPWVFWNNARALLSTAALGCLARACLRD